MHKDYERQVKSQIYNFLQDELGNFINSQGFDNVPKSSHGKTIINKLEIINKEAKNKYSDFNQWFISENISFISKSEFDLWVEKLSEKLLNNFSNSLEKMNNNLDSEEFLVFILSILKDDKDWETYIHELYYWSIRATELMFKYKDKTSEEVFKDVLNTSALIHTDKMLTKFQALAKFDGIINQKPRIGNSPTVYHAYREAFEFIYSLDLTEENSEIIRNRIHHLDEIYSSISGNKMCYIATMVYENQNHPKVEFLRYYRDTKLSKSILGRVFIKSYYTWSPSAVKYLEKYDFIKNIIRKCLNRLIFILK